MSVADTTNLKDQIEAEYERSGTDALDGAEEMDENQATVVTLLSSCHDEPLSQ
jgi:hypothetical protein